MKEDVIYNPDGVYKLRLASVPESIALVDNLIDDLVDLYQIPPEAYANIITSLNEAVTNAIYHGNKQNPVKTISVDVEVINSKKIIFIVEDEGLGFDFKVLPDPTAPENLENLAGRGVFIMKKLADQCIFNTTGSQIELHFRL